MLVEEIRRFYTNQAVRSRIADYCGGRWDYPISWTSRYLVGFGLHLKRNGYTIPVRVVSNTGIESLTDGGLDLFRSVLDEAGLLAVLDVEYFSLDGLADMYRFPNLHLKRMEPVYSTLKNLYRRFGIRTLHNVTASGFHFIGFLGRGGEAWSTLSKPLYLPPSLRAKYRLVVPDDIKRLEPVAAETGYAYERLGRMLTYLCHQAMRQGGGHTSLPLIISDAAPGGVKHARDGISLDLTQYADPVYMRPIRMPFTSHQKHMVNVHMVDADIAATLPAPIVIPREDQDLETLYAISTDHALAAEYAAETRTVIPRSPKGWMKLAEEYAASRLFRFHQALDEGCAHLEEHPGDARPLPAAECLPPCLRPAVTAPNPWLLVPTNLMAFCHHLRETGYTPAEIALGIGSTYAQARGWHINWNKYDPWSKALFWVRSYCGMLDDGLLGPDQFTCAAHQRRGFCPKPGCGRALGKEPAAKTVTNRPPAPGASPSSP